MNRLGIAIALVLVLAAIGFATLVRVTGPGWSGGVRAPSPTPALAPALPGAAPPPLVIPVQGVRPDQLADSWGDARGGGTRPHQGIDIPAPADTPVLAAADGRIEKLFTSGEGGLTVYERTADGGTILYYAHLDRYAPTLAEGQPVRAGTPIAGVGNTGDADGGPPHLHFEVHRMTPGEGWWQGEAIDPYPLLHRG